MRILVIDDDDDFRLLASDALRHEGYDIIAATDGEQGLVLQRKCPADLLITDIIMPNKEGFETMRDFRLEFPGAKMIAVTGGGHLQDAGYLVTAKQLGASEILRKPFPMNVLVNAVRKTLTDSAPKK